MAAIHYSRQREAIRDYLCSTKEHPTAETVYSHLRDTFPNISLGTVYRNLNFLVEHGNARKLDFGDGCDRFDGDISPHNHFFCRSCGRVIDLEMDSINHINVLANAGFDGKVEGHTIFFYGECGQCTRISETVQ